MNNKEHLLKISIEFCIPRRPPQMLSGARLLHLQAPTSDVVRCPPSASPGAHLRCCQAPIFCISRRPPQLLSSALLNHPRRPLKMATTSDRLGRPTTSSPGALSSVDGLRCPPQTLPRAHFSACKALSLFWMRLLQVRSHQLRNLPNESE